LSQNIGYPENKNAEQMVARQIRARGITDERLLSVMERVPRHLFAGGKARFEAYGDYPLSIGQGQTISQPYMVAVMTQELRLRGNERILEIGTGSGYQTAILAELGGEVYTVERLPALLKRAKAKLDRLGYTNIRYRIGDGSRGWPEQAPFDRILVTAAAEEIPPPLKAQVVDNGLLVLPLGEVYSYQVLMILRRLGHRFESRESIGCRFVPLVCG
jgi:protein-L-isoaspartate(D-aspartate) O-methyltransferase